MSQSQIDPRILIIEKRQLILKMIFGALSSLGLRNINHVSDINEAVELLKKTDYDLIVCNKVIQKIANKDFGAIEIARFLQKKDEIKLLKIQQAKLKKLEQENLKNQREGIEQEKLEADSAPDDKNKQESNPEIQEENKEELRASIGGLKMSELANEDETQNSEHTEAKDAAPEEQSAGLNEEKLGNDAQSNDALQSEPVSNQSEEDTPLTPKLNQEDAKVLPIFMLSDQLTHKEATKAQRLGIMNVMTYPCSQLAIEKHIINVLSRKNFHIKLNKSMEIY